MIALHDDGAPLLRRRVLTPTRDYLGILDAVSDLVTFAEQELAQKASVGVATPGAISPKTGFIKNSNSIILNGKPLNRDLSIKLERPIRLENDANCFALSEAVDGAAAQAGIVFGVILGTGVGGGLVVNRQVITGRNKIAGEWGHNPLPWAGENELPGPSCYCGKSGCIETFLSGAGLARDYHIRTGLDLSARDIALAVTARDHNAAECLDAYKNRLARSLATVINVLDPDAIVLGGGLSNLTQLYDELPGLIAIHAFSDSIDTPIMRAQHGDSSGVRGAAWLWPAISGG
jgi:fructokinase